MSSIVTSTAEMLQELPESEQKLAYEFIKRLVLAWDPDFSKVTPSEKQRIEEAEQEYMNGEYVEYKFQCEVEKA